MEITIGLLIILIAGFFQGSFVLPMTFAKSWNWENTWLSFSLFGMVVLNLLLAFLFIPHLLSLYQSIPTNDLLLLISFGLGWGIGAVLFGIAMNRLGMSLGYPVIMGLIATFGALIPMLIFHRSEVFTARGLIIILGSAIMVGGIILCSKAFVLKENSAAEKSKNNRTSILIAVAAGILSCLPNVGFSFGASLVTEALNTGVSNFMAGNAVWALFFTMGFIPNTCYTIYLLIKNKSIPHFKVSTAKNLLLGFLMAFMWIASFYLYGISTIKLGAWGAIIGWPLFISLSIIIGNLWGMVKSEWSLASRSAKLKLRQGMLVIFFAIIIIGVCNIL